MYLDIYEAIESRHLLQFYYDHYFRIVEPHLYGCDRYNRDVMRGFQVAGSDELGVHIGWKWYHTREMHHVTVLSTAFAAPRNSFSLAGHELEKIYCQVDGSPAPFAASVRHRTRTQR